MEAVFSSLICNISGKNTERLLMAISNRLVLVFCRLGVVGVSPWAPGTCGTVFALLLAPFLFLPFGVSGRLLFLCVLFIAGGVAATRGEKLLGKKDPGEIVIDELVGVWIALLPFAEGNFSLFLAAFCLFRLFDILKPWPVSASENWLPAGFGVMLDDVIAGMLAMFCLLLLQACSLL